MSTKKGKITKGNAAEQTAPEVPAPSEADEHEHAGNETGQLPTNANGARDPRLPPRGTPITKEFQFTITDEMRDDDRDFETNLAAEATGILRWAVGRRVRDTGILLLAVQRTCVRCKIRRITFHALRHTFASLALEAGMPLLEVSRTLGHGSVAFTAQKYIHLDRARLVESVDKLDTWLSAASATRCATR